MKLIREQVLKNLEDIVRFGGLMMSSEFVESVRIAMEAYEQEPCEDAISLADVFEIMGNLLSIPYDFDRNINETDVKKAMDDIRELKPVQPKAKLIPVSKRLPKAGEYVGNVPKYYLVQNEYGDMMVARYTHSEYWEQIYQHQPIADEIVAWCELPERYRSESEE